MGGQRHCRYRKQQATAVDSKITTITKTRQFPKSQQLRNYEESYNTKLHGGMFTLRSNEFISQHEIARWYVSQTQKVTTRQHKITCTNFNHAHLKRTSTICTSMETSLDTSELAMRYLQIDIIRGLSNVIDSGAFVLGNADNNGTSLTLSTLKNNQICIYGADTTEP